MKLAEINIVEKEQAVSLYNEILTNVMEFIVLRSEQYPDYGWVDTKRSLITGLDYLDDDLFKGKNTVYGWIQGRALEALALHGQWFEENSIRPDLVAGIRRLLAKVLAHLEYSREINGGHCFFFMDKDGRAFRTDKQKNIEYLFPGSIETYNFSDLFCSKGMYAAAKYLGLSASINDARQYCLEVNDALWRGNFASDQFSFRGKIASSRCILNSIGPYMLLLDTADMLLEHDCVNAAKMAVRLIEKVMDNHINISGKWGFGRLYDCIENVDTDGKPSIINGEAESDPGHTIEFAGLAMKFIYDSRRYRVERSQRQQLDHYQDILIEILKANFENGYVKGVGGICKGFDLVSRTVIDSDMPWWSMPETMRAALYAADNRVDDPAEKDILLDIYYKCHQGFADNYLRPELDYMSVQTIDHDGLVAETIPATPDADPGYHTGICLIDCLRLLDKSEKFQ
jgi:hypothetical protein